MTYERNGTSIAIFKKIHQQMVVGKIKA